MTHSASLATTFAALGDPTRIAIVDRLLREGECSVGEIAEPFDMSMPAISKHLSVLERADIIERRVDRQRRLCRVKPKQLRAVNDWLETHRRFWEASFDRLEQFLADEDNQANSPKSSPFTKDR